ncbi:hypothetical protein HK097_008653 [Rhizophlyctis rosea]|uniref:Gfo/Idh/MocA-like oxidoreductase N-terminal domain-containing protein n=1 Tax=Rhizophlyctis rosea TaxID=64517 RepID=A0AAD5SPY8_9FUNG|nr:hypothetical protein HK097_008653 [Rhizophlyctis rosea]
MRRRGKIDRLAMVGTTGKKNAQIREHLAAGVGAYNGIDTNADIYPEDGVEKDYEAYKAAIDSMKPGDGVTIFTPDDTHFDIALYAIQHKLHVLIAKPSVKTVEKQSILIQEARKNGVICGVEFHKRFDPMYADAALRMPLLGDFSFYSSYMAQPKAQLLTFRSWAGKSSDISYYLNSHHIDIHTWGVKDIAVPISVTASAATGVATKAPYSCVEGTEDTITLLVKWRNIHSGNLGTAVYTSSWIAPKGDVHTQQYFHYMGHTGELRIDQAHRGYTSALDDAAYASHNPLYIRYTPDDKGNYVGQGCYSHRSIEEWADACAKVNEGKITVQEAERLIPTIESSAVVTAILEAGRKSLDAGGVTVEIEKYDV